MHICPSHQFIPEVKDQLSHLLFSLSSYSVFSKAPLTISICLDFLLAVLGGRSDSFIHLHQGNSNHVLLVVPESSNLLCLLHLNTENFQKGVCFFFLSLFNLLFIALALNMNV